MKELKDLHKQKHTLSRTERLSMRKNSIFSPHIALQIYYNSNKIPSRISGRGSQVDSKIYVERKGNQNATKILKKTARAGEITLPTKRVCKKATVTTSV